jgi:hypothetical protein
MASPRRCDGLHELTYLFHDRDVSSPAVAAACATGGNTSTVLAGKHLPSGSRRRLWRASIMRPDLAYFNLEQKTLRPVRHQVVADAVAPPVTDVVGTDKSEICGEGGILCQGSKDLGNCGKISASGQPRWVCPGTGGSAQANLIRPGVNASRSRNLRLPSPHLRSGTFVQGCRSIAKEHGPGCGFSRQSRWSS